jgi:hypothetical protein
MQNNNPKWGQLLVLSGTDTHLICLAGHFFVIQKCGKIWRTQVTCCMLSCVVLNLPHSFFSFSLSLLVLSSFAMPKVNPRNEVGVIVHTVSKRSSLLPLSTLELSLLMSSLSLSTSSLLLLSSTPLLSWWPSPFLPLPLPCHPHSLCRPPPALP